MKKNTLILSLVLALQVATIQKSEAVLIASSTITGPASSVIALGIVAGLAVGLCSGGIYFSTKAFIENDRRQGIGLTIAAAVGIAWGVLVLGDDGSAFLEFRKLDLDRAQEYGLTTAEIEMYNSEVPKLNATLESVAQNVLFEIKQSNAKTIDKIANCSKDSWNTYSDLFHASTMKVSRKISEGLIQGFKI